VSIDANGGVFLQETAIDIADLVPRLTAISNGAFDRRIFVRGDRSINYGRVMEVMGLVNAAGFTKVALVAVAPSSGPAPAAPRGR
jgi:biopolymer transport protein TolR